MTVQELIKKLQSFEQDYEVLIDGDFDLCSMDEIEFDIFDSDKIIYIS